MWICPKCREPHPDHFEICWACGTNCDGTEDPAFQSEIDDNRADARSDVIPVNRRKWQFSLRALFVTIAVISMITALSRAIPEILVITLIGAVAANVLGVIVGWIVTYVLRVPNDGSLTWRQPADDSDADEVESIRVRERLP